MTAYRALTYREAVGGIFSGASTNYVRLAKLSFGPAETADVNDNEATVLKTNVILQEGLSGITNSVIRINGGVEGDILILRCATNITLEDGAGSGGFRLQVQSDYTVTSPNNPIWFVRSGAHWLELFRAINT